MKNIILLVVIVSLVACKHKVKQQAALTENNKTEIITKTEGDTPKNNTITSNSNTDLLGFYVGRFDAVNYENVSKKNGSYSNKINISIDSIKGGSLYGHSVVAGNSRPFEGTLDPKTLLAIVSEPGDDKYDGGFEFTFYPEKKEIKGIWIANNKKLAVPKREYMLTKKEFFYDPNLNLNSKYEESLSSNQTELMDAGYRLESINSGNLKELNSSTQELINQDIENLNKGELEVLRNLIYARHGYSFKNRKMRYFFDMNVDWYIPVSTDIRSKLTDLEKKNIDLIKRYEQHAERYYDYFGR